MSPIQFTTATAPIVPANISIANARLPKNYEQAVTALAACATVDECVDWSDKAAALASYAKQADDPALLNYAKRVQARATRRAGELLKQIEPAKGANQNIGAGDHPKVETRKEVAEQAGMSPHQAKQALRVANVPATEFEKQVESTNPPTVTKLAEQGTAKRGKPDWMPDSRPEGFKAATHLIGSVERFAEFCSKEQPEIVAAAVLDSEVQDLRRHVATIDTWLDRFVINLEG